MAPTMVTSGERDSINRIPQCRHYQLPTSTTELIDSIHAGGVFPGRPQGKLVACRGIKSRWQGQQVADISG